MKLRVAGRELRVAGWGLRVTGCALWVVRYGEKGIEHSGQKTDVG